MSSNEYQDKFVFHANASEFDLSNAYTLAQAARLAYESEETINSVMKPWGFAPVHFFDGKAEGTQGFIACHQEVIFLAFRGTQPAKVKDWVADAKASLKNDSKGKVHHGFKDALDVVWQEIKNKLDEYQNHARRPLWLTGHSLGAALATLAAARLAFDDDQVIQGLCNFGSPRVGNNAFTKAFDARIGERTFRFVNNNDVVTRAPAPFPTLVHPFSLYQHVGQMKYFDTEGALREQISGYGWKVFKDHFSGRLKDLGELGSDGMTDHSMVNYQENCRKNL